MTKEELRALNDELIAMLVTMRDQIDEKLDELEAIEDAEKDDADEDEGDED